jgi:hypothetical protein
LTCRPRRIATTLLPAASVHEKGGVLEGSEISRILPVNDSGSAMKIRDLSTRPRFRGPAICGFVAKNWGVLGGFRFFLALPKNTLKPRVPKHKTAGYLLSPKWDLCFAKPNLTSK